MLLYTKTCMIYNNILVFIYFVYFSQFQKYKKEEEEGFLERLVKMDMNWTTDDFEIHVQCYYSLS